ncbi:MAG: helix-hairpin-helix domain-containing protein [Bacilli bacterium]|nr:helix-hairpin-helix domain-containing protein [Bacilli bacterium]
MEIFLKYLKKYYIHIIIIVVIFLGSIAYIYGKGSDDFDNVEPDIELNVPKDELNETEEFVIFDIKGAVKNPGAYKLNKDKRIYDAIRVSGGLTTNADTTLINLSKKLVDEMVIIIHTKEQVYDYTKSEPTIIYKDVECNCPELKNDGCVSDETNDKLNNKLSLNDATLEELMELPGIGEAKAKSIIEYRNEVNGFTDIEELLNIKGIGETVLAKFKDLITI